MGGEGSVWGFPRWMVCGAAPQEMLSPLHTWGGPKCPTGFMYGFILFFPLCVWDLVPLLSWITGGCLPLNSQILVGGFSLTQVVTFRLSVIFPVGNPRRHGGNRFVVVLCLIPEGCLVGWRALPAIPAGFGALLYAELSCAGSQVWQRLNFNSFPKKKVELPSAPSTLPSRPAQSDDDYWFLPSQLFPGSGLDVRIAPQSCSNKAPSWSGAEMRSWDLIKIIDGSQGIGKQFWEQQLHLEMCLLFSQL